MEYASHARLLLIATMLLLLLLLQQKPADSASLSTTDPKSDTGNSVKKERPPSPQDSATTMVSITPKPASPAVADADKQMQLPGSKSTVGTSNNAQSGDVDFPETYTAVFYVLVGITSSAILLLIVRIYR